MLNLNLTDASVDTLCSITRGTDLGRAQLLSNVASSSIRKLDDTSQWAVWNGVRWETRTAGDTSHLAPILNATAAFLASRVLKTKAAQNAASNAELEPALARAAVARLIPELKLREKEHAGFTSAAGRQSLLSLAGALPVINVPVADAVFDRNEHVVGVENGSIDLRTGTFSTPDPALYLTETLATKYDAQATCPKWEQYLAEVFETNPEVIPFIQKLVGLSLSGWHIEHFLIMLNGGGANGKSVFLNVLNKLFGSLGHTLEPTTLLATAQSGGIPADVAALRGKRFAALSELPQDHSLDEASVKRLTGEDAVRARFLYENAFTFTPQFTPWLATNYLPRITGSDMGIWRRIVVIDFERTFTRENRNANLTSELLAELPGILNWAVEGAKQVWADQGAEPPASVVRSNRKYQENQDLVAHFIAENMNAHTETGAARPHVELKPLYDAFKVWAEGTQCIKRAPSMGHFKKRLSLLGYEEKRQNNGTRRVYNLSWPNAVTSSVLSSADIEVTDPPF